MPQTQVSTRFSGDRLYPILRPDLAISMPVVLAPLTVFAAGQVIAQVSTSADDVQTFAVAGTPTAGSVTFSVTNTLTGLASNLVVPYNATSSVLQGLATVVFGSGNITAGGGPWPGTPLTLTGAGILAATPLPVALLVANGLDAGAAPSVAHTTTGVKGGSFAKYDDALSTGVEVAMALLEHPCATDAAGRVTLGATATGGQHGETMLYAPAFFGGFFDTSKLVGLDANGLADLGKLIKGTLAAGILKF